MKLYSQKVFIAATVENGDFKKVIFKITFFFVAV